MWRYQRDIHTLLNYLYSHIVYSNKSCMFEVLQRCSQPNTTMIMKTIKVTYTETYIVTEERIVEVSNATFKKLQNEDSEEYERLLEEMNGVTCAIESPTERDQTFMDRFLGITEIRIMNATVLPRCITY